MKMLSQNEAHVATTDAATATATATAGGGYPAAAPAAAEEEESETCWFTYPLHPILTGF